MAKKNKSLNFSGPETDVADVPFIEVEPAAWRIIWSIKNHSWYLDQEIVIMCLASEDSDNFEEVEKVAKKLFKTSKGIISTERVRA